MLQGTGIHMICQIFTVNFSFCTLTCGKGKVQVLVDTCLDEFQCPCAAQYLYTLVGRGEDMKDTPLHDLLLCALEVAVEARNQTPGTFLLDMTLHLTTKFFSSAVIRTLQFDVETSSVISGGKVLFILTNLEHHLAAMLSGTFSSPVFLLVGCVHVIEIFLATVRAGLVLQQPFLKAVLIELLPTAVHQVRLTQHFHTNKTGQLFSRVFNKLIVNIFSSHFVSLAMTILGWPDHILITHH